MFYQMIEKARDKWLASDDCTIKDLVHYMEKKGQLRDVQIEAIKTYLFLKIACNNNPLSQLFIEGKFNSIMIPDLEEEPLGISARKYLQENPSALALYEYAKHYSMQIVKQIQDKPQSINYNEFWNKVFYGVSYTEYLFSLPMGAGKTFLMACFIYLDLYFALNDRENKTFAHNFIIFAPSGLKSSVIPSLKTIQKFEPSWVIPEPVASQIKRKLIFEVLDENKTQKKSNKVKNPNVQKIANHQPYDKIFGLVAVTNAEKVILDRIVEKNGQIYFWQKNLNDREDRLANELRNTIGKINSLAVFIDEVHHAVSDEIKLRAVVNKWTENGNVSSVIGFSGTPYLEKQEKIDVSGELQISSIEIANIVFYYPLINGIGNFLKKPVVKVSSKDSKIIVKDGVREFLDNYLTTTYNGGLTAKLGIYCGLIEKLETVVYPIVKKIVKDPKYKLTDDCILKFHKGNNDYPQPEDSQYQFDILDSPLSKKKIVLLAQIGKEGWDCKSLTSIILSQENDCPQNMVLQTSCRCLRQVEKNKQESALIYLNAFNEKKLSAQLKAQQHITIDEFQKGKNNDLTAIERFDRTEYLNLQPIDFYQLQVSFDTTTLEAANPAKNIGQTLTNSEKMSGLITTQELSGKIVNREIDDKEHGTQQAIFYPWLNAIAKESFNFITLSDLKKHEKSIKHIFDKITFEKDNARYFSSKYDLDMIKANIRKTFYDKRDYKTKETLDKTSARFLNNENFSSLIYTENEEKFYPSQDMVKNIIADDKGKLKINRKTQAAIKALEDINQYEQAQILREKLTSHPQKDHSFHYLPYKTDSDFEIRFLHDILTLEDIKHLDLEVYYNGDKELTEFKIKTYKKHANGRWQYIGMYTPDFLIIQRKNNAIHKAIIVETKGELYSHDPNFIARREFMQGEWLKQNNKRYNYKRFDYLCLIEKKSNDYDHIERTYKTITKFFREQN